jgi:hypothetical protein
MWKDIFKQTRLNKATKPIRQILEEFKSIVQYMQKITNINMDVSEKIQFNLPTILNI